MSDMKKIAHFSEKLLSIFTIILPPITTKYYIYKKTRLSKKPLFESQCNNFLSECSLICYVTTIL